MTELSIGIKHSIALFFMLAIWLLTGSAIHASADSYADISVPDEVPRGSEFSVRVTFSADDIIGTARGTLGYSEQDAQFISSQYASGGGGIVTISAFPQAESTELTVTLTFRALRTGISDMTLTNGSVMSPDGVMLAGGIWADTALSISDSVSESTDSEMLLLDDSVPDALKGTLATLTVSTGELVPAFSPGIYDYTVTVTHDVDYLGIDAEPAGKYDTIWFEGSEYLADGSTPRTVTVTSLDGLVTNVYTIKVIRLAEGQENYPAPIEDAVTDPTDDEAVSSLSDSVSAGLHSSPDSVSPRPRVRSSSSDTDSRPETLRDRLMPLLIAAMAVIIIVAAILVVRIRVRQKNKLG